MKNETLCSIKLKFFVMYIYEPSSKRWNRPFVRVAGRWCKKETPVSQWSCGQGEGSHANKGWFQNSLKSNISTLQFLLLLLDNSAWDMYIILISPIQISKFITCPTPPHSHTC